jgi:hypothetical protein
VPLSNEIKALPNVAGFGNMTDLQQAIAKDGSGQLKALVQQFVNSANLKTPACALF